MGLSHQDSNLRPSRFEIGMHFLAILSTKNPPALSDEGVSWSLQDSNLRPSRFDTGMRYPAELKTKNPPSLSDEGLICGRIRIRT